MEYKNIGFTVSKVKNCLEEEKILIDGGFKKIESVSDLKKNKIDLLFVLGGDGFMLRTIHKYLNCKVDFYGVNCGTQGFLLNNPKYLYESSMSELLKNSKKYTINPLKAKIINNNGKEKIVYAINEIAILRSTHNASHIKIFIEDTERLPKLICDGIIVSSPAGSTAYNLSLNGPILPLDSNFVAITPISPFCPRLWRGALVKNNKKIKFEMLSSDTRTVSVTSDYNEFKNALTVEISVEFSKKVNILFNNFENIEEKIINQQFNY